MNLQFNLALAEQYKSSSQRARRLTEGWLGHNMYCPRCGNPRISHIDNNKPVADFCCPACENIYELKSKNGAVGDTVNDGAYGTMIERITSSTNPDFFFLSYTQTSVDSLFIVPKYFFVPDVIIQRKPLAPSARRAGWTGCNIRISAIPKQGRIPIIQNGTVYSKESVVEILNRSKALETSDIESRGWLFDVLNCVNAIQTDRFSLDHMYRFENQLSAKHPNNNNIQPKIRQQLQYLRDRGIIEFLGNGQYKKL